MKELFIEIKNVLDLKNQQKTQTKKMLIITYALRWKSAKSAKRKKKKKHCGGTT